MHKNNTMLKFTTADIHQQIPNLYLKYIKSQDKVKLNIPNIQAVWSCDLLHSYILAETETKTGNKQVTTCTNTIPL